MKYNKLVRDNIPEIIKTKGFTAVTHVADDEEYWEKLKEKLHEEVQEFIAESNEEELADILEVVYAIRDFKNIEQDKLEETRYNKAQERGGFKQRIILERTEEMR